MTEMLQHLRGTAAGRQVGDPIQLGERYRGVCHYQEIV
jgi:hypothetical protein